MLENIPNNSMYTTDIQIERKIEPYYEETQYDYFNSIEYIVDSNRNFINDEQDYLEDLIKHEPILEY